MKFFSAESVDQLPNSPSPDKWTAVIPAAGRGSRLGYDKPKILYPIAGRLSIDWLIDLLAPQCSRFVFILSPSGVAHVQPHLEQRIAGRYDIVIQEEPRGMADAISYALPKLTTPHSLIIWGDQVGIRPTTLQRVRTLHESLADTPLTLPIVSRDNPYVHYATDDTGRFTHVLERREGAAMPEIGQSDCGLFACDTARLQAIFAGEVERGIQWSKGTKEWNFLPLLPQFDTDGTVAALRLESREETIGVNDQADAAVLEEYLLSLRSEPEKEKLRVVLFSGGRGTGSITDALLKYPEIDLTLLVNAYDDGKSTGLLRRFIPGMLGPSDIRKVVSSLLKAHDDPSAQALRQLIEYRFPDETETGDALSLLGKLSDWHVTPDSPHEVLVAKEHLRLSCLRDITRYLEAFLAYYEQTITDKPWFTFADNSLGNLFFAGCYLLHGQDFNQAITAFCHFAQVPPCVLNVTHGENLVLTGIKENGAYLYDEASVVGPQDASRIEEIFLLPQYVEPGMIDQLPTKDKKIATLRQLETLPQLNPAAESAVRQADIIIYGPGTQHSSLYPSYLTVGLAEAVRGNRQAEKIFIANIARDYDILTDDASTLVKGLLFNMSRKGALTVAYQDYVTRFFFQKPEPRASAGSDYVPFVASNFDYPLDRVVWIDLEGAAGKHAGGRTVSELLLVVEEQLRKRVRHVPHKVSVIVPALNEEKTIGSVIASLRSLHFPDPGLEKEIIVVDGGSSDKTYAIAQSEPGIRSYQLAGPRGRGAALRLGLSKARGEIVVFFPSDGEYKAEDIVRIVTTLLTQEFPVVFGSRAFQSNDLSVTLQRIYGGRGAVFLLSKYGGMLLSILSLLLYQRYVSDPLTSLKGFRTRVFRGMEWRRTGVDFDMEIIAKVARARYPILEVPVSYKARTVQEGKKVTVSDGVKSLMTLLRFARYNPNRRQKLAAEPATERRSVPA